MKFRIKKIIDREICHFASPDTLITSLHNKVYVKKKADEFKIILPNNAVKQLLGLFRLSRRALRLDKCNVVPVKDGFVLIRQGKVYYYNETQNKINNVLSLRNCRNVLHQSILVIDNKILYFGEYGNNSSRLSVPIYRSIDGGQNWETIFMFPPGCIKHVHGCYYDPFEDKIWTFTGDFENECHVLCADRNFNKIEWIGDGSQVYRTCNAFFEQNSVHWIMDSQLQISYHIELNRKTRQIKQKQFFPGPVWYIKRLSDGYYLAATAQEIGLGVQDQYAHLMVSEDLDKWIDIYQFQHDGFPKKYFKFGVIGFPDGIMDSRSFYFFAEAIEQYDGKTVLCEIY